MTRKSPAPSQAQLPIVFWAIWFSILMSVVMIPFFIGGGIPSGPDDGQAPVVWTVMPVVLAVASLGLRFKWLPRVATLNAKLPVMIIGLALAESIAVISAVLVDKRLGETRLTHLVIALACVLAWIPIFTRSTPSDASEAR